MLCMFRRLKMSANNNTSKRENIEQIPKEENIGEVEKAVSEQVGRSRFQSFSFTSYITNKQSIILYNFRENNLLCF